jgi:hypothetical protein
MTSRFLPVPHRKKKKKKRGSGIDLEDVADEYMKKDSYAAISAKYLITS